MRYRLAECLTQEGRSRSSNAAQSARGYRAVCAARTGRDGAVGRRLACTRTPLAPGEMLPRGSSLWRRWSLDAASGRENVTCSHSTFGGVRTPMAFALRFGECGGTKLAGVCGLSFPSNLRRGGLVAACPQGWFARQFGCGNAIRFSEGRRGCRMRWARLRSSSRAAARTARVTSWPSQFIRSLVAMDGTTETPRGAHCQKRLQFAAFRAVSRGGGRGLRCKNRSSDRFAARHAYRPTHS